MMTLAQLFPIAKPASFLFISGCAGRVAAAFVAHVRDVLEAGPSSSDGAILRGKNERTPQRYIDQIYPDVPFLQA